MITFLQKNEIPRSEGAPVGLSVAGTLGVDDFSELGYRPALLPHKT